MKRIPEPELMEDQAQARAYAEADFEEPHSMFVRLWEEWHGSDDLTGDIVDLGCGPADITVRFAERYPLVTIDGVDGSRAMLDCARERIRARGVESRIRLIHGLLPDAGLPPAHYDAVISNSLLHHLEHPDVLWRTIRACARPGAPVFVMDLMRPETRADAEALAERYAADAPPVLRHDFFHSLLAAWRPDEVRAQLMDAGLSGFEVHTVSDRHFIVRGQAPSTEKNR